MRPRIHTLKSVASGLQFQIALINHIFKLELALDFYGLGFQKEFQFLVF